MSKEAPTMNEFMTLLGRVEHGDLKARLTLRELFRALTLTPVRMTFDTLDDVTLTDAQKLEKARELIAELRAVLLAARREADALRDAIVPLIKKYGYGSKAGRADYVVMIPGDEFDVLRRVVDPPRCEQP